MKRLVLFLFLVCACFAHATNPNEDISKNKTDVAIRWEPTGPIPRSTVILPTAWYDGSASEIGVNPYAESGMVDIQVYGDCGPVAMLTTEADGEEIRIAVPDLQAGWYTLSIRVRGMQFYGDFEVR